MRRAGQVRAPRRSAISSELNFDADPTSRTTWFFGPVLTATLVSLLGVAVAAGVLGISAQRGQQQDPHSLVVDHAWHDQSSAVAVDRTLTAEQTAGKQVSLENRGTAAGGLQVFGQRGTTVNRTSVRVALTQTLTSGAHSTRTQSLKSTSTEVASSIATTEQQRREQQMAADVAKVKAEAHRIAEEKRKAEELLRLKMLEALRQAESHNPATKTTSPGSPASKATPRTKKRSTSPDSPSTTATDSWSQADVSALLGDQSVCLPLAPGTFRVGAHFGQYGVWARYHTGQDFPAAYGTPIRAVSAGVVGSPVRAWWPGTNVVIHHVGGGSTLYAHMSRSAVSPGQMVSAGQVIGYVGSTGNSYGNHLHFEYYPRGTTPGDVYSAANPMAFLRSLGLAV